MLVKSGEKTSASQAQTMDDIAVGHDNKSNTFTFYNPLTHKYYHPPAKLNKSHLPFIMYPKNICFDSGLMCGLLRNSTDPVPELFPPSTRVNITLGKEIMKGTVQNIPFPFSSILTLQAEAVNNATSPSSDDTNTSPKSKYTILLNNGSTTEVDFPAHITPQTSMPQQDLVPDAFSGLPSNSKISMDHDGWYQKGFLQYSPESGFSFVVKRYMHSSKIDLCAPLPNFHHTGLPWWATMSYSPGTLPIAPSSVPMPPTMPHLPILSLLKAFSIHAHLCFKRQFMT